MPDDFTRQGRASGWESVKIVTLPKKNISNLNGDFQVYGYLHNKWVDSNLS